MSRTRWWQLFNITPSPFQLSSKSVVRISSINIHIFMYTYSGMRREGCDKLDDRIVCHTASQPIENKLFIPAIDLEDFIFSQPYIPVHYTGVATRRNKKNTHVDSLRETEELYSVSESVRWYYAPLIINIAWIYHHELWPFLLYRKKKKKYQILSRHMIC